MPWTRLQQKTAQAVAHGWSPKGNAKNFAKTIKKGGTLAEDIISESKTMPTRKAVKAKGNKAAEDKLGAGARMAPKGRR